MRRLAGLLVIFGFAAAASRASATNWPVFGFDPSRSGFNPAERTLTVSNVHRLHERWQISLGATADSTPILLQHVRIGRGYHEMLYQTTKAGVTLGIEAVSGRIIWRFATRGSEITDSTPAADPSGQSIYVPGVDGKVHKLSASRQSNGGWGHKKFRSDRVMMNRSYISVRRPALTCSSMNQCSAICSAPAPWRL